MTNNLIKTIIELNFDQQQLQQINVLTTNANIIQPKSKRRTVSEHPQPIGEISQTGKRPEDLFKSIQQHVETRFKSMDKKESTRIINKLNNSTNVNKYIHKLTK